MIPRQCKRLAEVDFPIATVSKHAAREKSIRHGHPSTLHLWWARRPLASSRAVLLALLLPDPADAACPAEFKKAARELLASVQGKAGEDDLAFRASLLRFIGDFANWDLSAHPQYLKVARGLVRAAHGEEPPLVVDPFAGGGSIPLEALRLGCDAFASDLNPVAALILKVMLEDIPRHGPKLAEELRRVGKEIKEAAEKELAPFYPADPDGARPIAYLWARTVVCESCSAEIPLMRSFWLSKKEKRRRALRPRVERSAGRPPRVELEIFSPSSDADVRRATVSRAKATCLACNVTMAPERVRAQLAAQRGGADVVFDVRERTGGARLLAVVTLANHREGRQYRLPTDGDYAAVRAAQAKLLEIDKSKPAGGVSPVPDEPTPIGGGSGAGRAFSVQKYGITRFRDLFTARQNISLYCIASLTRDSATEARDSAALSFSKLTELGASLCAWEAFAECPRHVFTRQALSLAWDFAEGVPVSESSGSLLVCVDNVVEGTESIATIGRRTMPMVADAKDSPLVNAAGDVFFTDPPYYDAVPYADLSDFFFVWLKRALPGSPLLQDPFDPMNRLTPKTREVVQSERSLDESGKPKDRAFYESAMARAFAEGRRLLKDDAIGSVVFAHKTTEGWEALLSGLIGSGWTITASWPIATEMGSRLRARDSAALATSIHLICRPRDENAPVGDWANVLRELPRRVSEWMERLQEEGVRGADLVFACIGPALEIFSRYSRVETGDREVKLAEYLERVWEVVGRAALQQILGTAEANARNGVAGVLEEDARLTALFLWTLQSSSGANDTASSDTDDDDDRDDHDDDDGEPAGKKSKGFKLVYDVVRRFAQPLGIHLERWDGRVLDIEKGVVRLIPVRERAKQLFGQDGADSIAAELEQNPAASRQLALFGRGEEPARLRRRGGKRARAEDPAAAPAEATTLDRVHAAMLLQAGGRTNALRNLLKGEQDRGPEFLRLANALSALYPEGSDEERLLDAMLLAVPRR
jgi:adenine-specific DNA methylase